MGRRSAGAGGGKEVVVSRFGWIVPGLVCLTLGAAPPAQAQSNLDAGKSPAQIFSDTCNACHRSPRELKPTTPSFLREHYTTGAREAATMAAYVSSVGSDPRAVQQRRPPTMGAGQAAPGADTAARPPQAVPSTSTEQAKPPDAQQAALPTSPARRTPQAGDQAKPPQVQASVAMLRPRRPSDSVETTKPLVTLATGALSAPVEPPAPSPSLLDPFEE
jgi:hypothetical protein